MVASWIRLGRLFKSRWPVVAGFLLRSRETNRRKCKRLRGVIEELKKELDSARRQIARQQNENQELREQVQWLEQQQRNFVRSESIRLPEDPPVGTHGFGARMVTLGINLARVVGFRGAAKVMTVVFEWLGIEQKVPHWTSIRTWTNRRGLALLEEPPERADDWIWLADHSNQIGQEKVLTVLAVRASSLPPPGKTLHHKDVRVLHVQPGKEWKREDMARVYNKLAAQHGPPRAVLMDGAVELREGAQCLKEWRRDTLVLRDLKHMAANRLEALLGKDARFQQFLTQLSQTRSSIQQTELAHLTPPSQKQKSRFMNLAATLKWATLVSWVLNTASAQARAGVTAERLELKLGWLREYQSELPIWRECQRVISICLTFINTQGLFRGASTALRTMLGDVTSQMASQLTESLLAFLQESEELLREGERLWLSTEILESSFSLYKQLERQHSKGGFTSLLASFAALLKPATPKEVTQDFARVSNRCVKQWIAEQLGKTVPGRRQQAYREHKKATGATIALATT